jgi:hypothetical protein
VRLALLDRGFCCHRQPTVIAFAPRRRRRRRPARRSLQSDIRLTYLGSSFAGTLNLQPLGSALFGAAGAALSIGAGAAKIGVFNAIEAHYQTSPDRAGSPSSIQLRHATARRKIGVRNLRRRRVVP